MEIQWNHFVEIQWASDLTALTVGPWRPSLRTIAGIAGTDLQVSSHEDGSAQLRLWFPRGSMLSHRGIFANQPREASRGRCLGPTSNTFEHHKIKRYKYHLEAVEQQFVPSFAKGWTQECHIEEHYRGHAPNPLHQRWAWDTANIENEGVWLLLSFAHLVGKPKPMLFKRYLLD